MREQSEVHRARSQFLNLVFDFFQKYLFSHRAGALVKRISWLTVIGLTISVSSLLVVISVMTALNHNIEDRTLAVEPHFTVELPSIKSSLLLEAHPLTAKLSDQPDFRVSVFESQDVILRTLDGHFRGAIARGLSQKSLDRMLSEMQKTDPQRKNANTKNRDSVDSSNLSVSMPLSSGEILIGSDLAVSLGVFEGDSLMVVAPEGLLLPPTEAPQFDRVLVKKIITTNLADVDAQMLFYVRDHTLTKMSKSDSRKTGIEVWTKDPHHAEKFKYLIDDFPEAQMQTWKERNSSLFFALKIEKTIITLFLSLAALIASFSMISVMLLLISQKKKEIGLLQAIGLSAKNVQRLFMNIGLLLATVGLGSGLLIGLLISLWVEKHPLNVLPDIYYDSQIPAYVDIGFVFSVALVGSLIAVAGSYFSSQGAARTSPSEALRSKN